VGEKLLDRLIVARGFDFHRAVSTIRNLAGQAEPSRVLANEPSKANALHFATHDDAAAAYCVFPSHP
jgi:hypothetical protein